MSKIKCEGCGEDVPSYEVTHFGSGDEVSKLLCSRCFNAEVVRLSGVNNFDSTRLHPIGITDCTGEEHQFHFVTRLLGNMVTLDAFEVIDGDQAGYQFEIIGEPDANMYSLFGLMVERIRKALSVKYIKDAGDGHGLQITDMLVRGRISSEHEDGEYVPSVVVDGREISWDEFGRLISTYEGWNFKLELCDRSEER